MIETIRRRNISGWKHENIFIATRVESREKNEYSDSGDTKKPETSTENTVTYIPLKNQNKRKKLNKIESDIRGLSFIQRQNIRTTADFYP